MLAMLERRLLKPVRQRLTASQPLLRLLLQMLPKQIRLRMLSLKPLQVDTRLSILLAAQ